MVTSIFKRRHCSPALEDLAQRARRVQRERWMRTAGVVFWSVLAHLATGAAGAAIVYFGYVIPLQQRLAFQRPRLVRVQPAVNTEPVFKCTKDERLQVAESWARGQLNKRQVAEYAEMCRVRARMDQVK